VTPAEAVALFDGAVAPGVYPNTEQGTEDALTVLREFVARSTPEQVARERWAGWRCLRRRINDPDWRT
jgi:hypothetical protein